MKDAVQEIIIENELVATSRVHIQADAIRQLPSILELNKYSKIFILADDSVGKWLAELTTAFSDLKLSIFSKSFSDSIKKIDVVCEVWTAMHKAQCDRKSLCINLGGGVVSDLGGFCASTYMRGMDYVNIPTSLLAQVDASLGGKTGFNFDGVKNLLGTFSDPVVTVIDPKILSTLPKREYISGFAEIIKHGAICDRSFYDLVTSKQPLQFNDIEMADIIYKSCVIKKNITEQDRTERGMRKLLNFGHTVGHALEIQTLQGTNPLLHGEAVSIGMVAEAMIAVAVGKLSSSDLSLLTESLTNAGLPIACAGLELNGLISSMRSDKKNEGQALHFTLIDRLGHAEIDQIVAEEVVDGVLQALNEASL